MTGLGSAPFPPPGPEDRVRGPAGAALLIAYADYECPFCAALELRLTEAPVRHVFRHFPVVSKHPRSRAAAAAAEAAGEQGEFWAMHAALFADQGRLEDPHLWARAGALGLDLERFEEDRRSPAILARIDAQFRGGLRGGVVSTPGVVWGGRLFGGRAEVEALLADLVPRLSSPAPAPGASG